MPWALVELDSNAASSSPVRLEFRGRPSRWKHFLPSRRPLVAQLPPGRGSDEAAATSNAAAAPQDGEAHGGSGPGHLVPREALRVAAPRGQVAGGDMLLGQLRQSEAMHQHLRALQAEQLPAQRSQQAGGDARIARPLPALALPSGGAEREPALPSHRCRVPALGMPVGAKRQPSPRPGGPGAPPGAGAARMAPGGVPGIGLAGLDEAGGVMKSARRGAAFTPRSQAQEEAKQAHRRSMVNGFMKKLMDRSWERRKAAVEGLADIALQEMGGLAAGKDVTKDSLVMQAVVQHLASRNDKGRQAAVFALSRIAVFQNNDTVAKACLSLLMHANAEVRQVAPVALSHVITKGAPAARRLLAELESLLLHADRNVREAAVDAVVQVAAKGDREALQCLTVCFADADAMVRAVALEAAEMLLDNSLSSVLLVYEVLRSVCQGARRESAASQAFAAASSLESVQACRALTAHISIPLSVSCPACTSAGAAAASATGHAQSAAGPFQRSTVCGGCVAAISSFIVQHQLPRFFVAFCMGGHARLGRESPLGLLDVSLLPVIVGYVA